MVTVSESSSFESLKIIRILESHGIKVFVSYECIESAQPWTISSGGNYTTILKVNDVDKMKAEVLLKKYHKRELLAKEKNVIDTEQF
jgi:hypothetical protein